MQNVLYRLQINQTKKEIFKAFVSLINNFEHRVSLASTLQSTCLWHVPHQGFYSKGTRKRLCTHCLNQIPEIPSHAKWRLVAYKKLWCCAERCCLDCSWKFELDAAGHLETRPSPFPQVSSSFLHNRHNSYAAVNIVQFILYVALFIFITRALGCYLEYIKIFLFIFE